MSCFDGVERLVMEQSGAGAVHTFVSFCCLSGGCGSCGGEILN